MLQRAMMLKAIALTYCVVPTTAFQPALTRRIATKTPTPPPAFSPSATRRRPCLAVSAGGASSPGGGGRLPALLRALRSVGTISGLFLAAGLAEIGGGWLVWKAVREGAPRWWAACGALVLAAYGFIPCLQPIDDFGRLYAAYGADAESPVSRGYVRSLTGRRPRRWYFHRHELRLGPGRRRHGPRPGRRHRQRGRARRRGDRAAVAP
ncbi:unnamed protein product [Pelagomonas calceolata]|uniref:Uncharacterized protein n=1 Tax=Pelagomonas calceolata TaxID=35677 RepID=A0A7S4E230_9STRA|nr:unnamed protein product [Pelagomonas calceolata]